MHRDLRMILLKRLVNIPLRLVDLLLPSEPKVVHFPQTRMLWQVYDHMFKVYQWDVAQGTFSKNRDLRNPPDGNFERLLRVSRKVLIRLSEDDPYYRKWDGLAFVLAAEEWAARERDLQQLKRWIKEQWFRDIGFLPDSLVAACLQDFQEDAYCDFLVNLSRKEVGCIPASLDYEKFGGIERN